MAKKVRMKGQAKFNTHAYLDNGSNSLLENLNEVSAGGAYLCIGSILMAIFAVEAYLNAVGEAKIPYWDIVEPKLGWQQKLELVCRHFEIPLDYGKNPFSTLKALFTFRNHLVHGKTHTFESEYEENSGDSGMDPEWMKDYRTPAGVRRVRRDTCAVMDLIQTGAGMRPRGMISSGWFGEKS